MKSIKILIVTIIGSLLYISPISAEEVINQEDVNQNQENINQTWAVVDENGVVQNITVCSESVCGEGGTWDGFVPGTNLRVIKQNNDSRLGGHWGTYDFNSNTFTIDRSCSTCDPWENLITPGILRDGILTPPVFKLYEELVNEETLNVSEASNLLGYTMAFYQATSLSNTIKLGKNLKRFNKVSKTENICIVNKNKVLIKKTGTCKILVEGKNKKKVVKMKVYL